MSARRKSNEEIETRIAALENPAEPLGILASLTTGGVTHAGGATWDAIPFNNIKSNNGMSYNPGTGEITITKTAWYTANAKVNFVINPPGNHTPSIRAFITRPGGANDSLTGDFQSESTSGSFNFGRGVSFSERFEAGTVIKFEAFANSGSVATLQTSGLTYFSLVENR